MVSPIRRELVSGVNADGIVEPAFHEVHVQMPVTEADFVALAPEKIRERQD